MVLTEEIESTHTPTPGRRVFLPKSNPSRNSPGFVQILRRVKPWKERHPFEGAIFRCGQVVDVSALWPEPDYPAVPVALEYAGSDGSGRGHNRSPHVYVLWRWDGGRWAEVVRMASHGADWVATMAHVAAREVGGPPRPDPATAALFARRFLASLDADLGELPPDVQTVALRFLYEQVAARLVA